MGDKRVIIGIDPGTEFVGFAVLEQDLDRKDTPRPLEHDLIRAQGSRPFRLFWIHEKLRELFERHRARRRIDVAVELMFVGNNPQTSMILGEARGVVMAAAGAVPKARIFDYAPSSHKKSVAGHGGATKYQAMLAVRLLLGLEGDLPLDVSDAYCIAVHHSRVG